MTSLLAESFFGQGFFRTLFFLMLAFLWGFALFDLAKSHAAGWSKAVWVVVIIVLPFVGALAYLISRPSFAIETNPIDQPAFDPREREETALEMTHRSSS
jgi:Phospholipase_D-nuclease N-terminal